MFNKDNDEDMYDFKKLTERKVAPSISTRRLLDINRLQKDTLVNSIGLCISKSDQD